MVQGVTISSAARDAGHSGKTTTLRPGLLLGEIGDSRIYKQYDPSAVDGSEVATGILQDEVKVIDEDGNAVNADGVMVVHARVDTTALIGCDAGAISDLPAIIFD
jgi:hypothetical protein